MAGSSAAVAATKVAAPRPPSRYLRRARLIERLDESIVAGRGVVLVSAPAGAGKSTLVNGWLDGRSGRVGWLQIDEGDDDPSRFWAGVAAALRDAVPSLGTGVGAAFGDGVDAVVDAVVNAIGDAGHEVVLVIDDVSSEERNRQVVERYWEAHFLRDWDRMATFFSDDAHYTDVGVDGQGARGPQQIVDRLKIGIEPLSGYYHHPRHMVAEGDLVILEHVEEWQFHTGEVILHPFVTVMEVRD